MTISHGVDEKAPALIDVQIAIIQEELAEIKTMLVAIGETLDKADDTITTVAAEVMPTIDGLLKSPMLKMLMPKPKVK